MKIGYGDVVAMIKIRFWILCSVMYLISGTGLPTIWGQATTEPVSLFETGEHCVAYRAKKRLFLISRVNVVGRNCDISSQVIPVVGGKSHLEIVIPSQNFRSGETKRDRDVAKLLRANKYPHMVFHSKDLSKEKWHELTGQRSFEMDGILEIAEQKYPVTARVHLVETKEGLEADGIIVTKLKHFSIEAPELIAGVFAKVEQSLELHFHIQAQKTLGVESILPHPSL